MPDRSSALRLRPEVWAHHDDRRVHEARLVWLSACERVLDAIDTSGLSLRAPTSAESQALSNARLCMVRDVFAADPLAFAPAPDASALRRRTLATLADVRSRALAAYGCTWVRNEIDAHLTLRTSDDLPIMVKTTGVGRFWVLGAELQELHANLIGLLSAIADPCAPWRHLNADIIAAAWTSTCSANQTWACLARLLRRAPLDIDLELVPLLRSLLAHLPESSLDRCPASVAVALLQHHDAALRALALERLVHHVRRPHIVREGREVHVASLSHPTVPASAIRVARA